MVAMVIGLISSSRRALFPVELGKAMVKGLISSSRRALFPVGVGKAMDQEDGRGGWWDCGCSRSGGSASVEEGVKWKVKAGRNGEMMMMRSFI